jgi:hypothetical protein
MFGLHNEAIGNAFLFKLKCGRFKRKKAPNTINLKLDIVVFHAPVTYMSTSEKYSENLKIAA